MTFKRIYIEITNICNLSCSFCSPLKREKRSMTLNEIEHIFNEIKPYKPHIYLHIKGEPLTHKNFHEILKLAKKYSLPVNITTNGTLISGYQSELLEFARQINISVHSLCDGQIASEEKYIEDIINFGLSAKCKGYPNVSYRLWNGGKENQISGETLAVIKTLADRFDCEIPDEIKKGRNAVKLADNVYISFMNKFEWPALSKGTEKFKGSCLGGKEMLGILADGTVVPCCIDADGIINLGNIFNESLEKILNKERYKNILKGFSGGNLPEELCRKCDFYQSRK